MFLDFLLDVIHLCGCSRFLVNVWVDWGVLAFLISVAFWLAVFAYGRTQMNENEMIELVKNLLIQRTKLMVEIAERQKHAGELRKMVMEKFQIPPEVRKELEEIDAEFDTANLSAQLTAHENQIRELVLKIGHSVKVEGAGQAVFNNGRVTWNTKGLDGLMVAVPQLAQFRNVGEPYISFR